MDFMFARMSAIMAGTLILSSNIAIAEPSAAIKAVVDAAAKEGGLTLAYGEVLGGSDGAQELQQLVNTKFGTNLKFSYTPGPSAPEMAARMAQEAAAKRPSSTDIFLSSITSSNVNLFMPVDWREYLPDLPQEAMKFGQRSVTVSTHLIGITFNSQIIPPELAPASLADLLKPEWKGKIAARISTTFMSYLALPEVLGHDGSIQFFKQLGTQASGMMRCGSWERIASGEFPIFFPDCGDYDARVAQRVNAPVSQIIPREGGGFAVNSVGIPTNSAHPNAAKLLIMVLLEREGQEFIWSRDGTDSYLMPDSHMAKIMAQWRAKGIKFFDEIDLESTRPDLVAAQKEMFQALQDSVQR
jgi:ABC-type Fe3+ transport system substrate-binding protein